jgi:HlyD family secretion protein
MAKTPLFFILVLLVTVCLLTSCNEKKKLYNGYIEADYVYVSSYSDGKIKNVFVSKGQRIKKGTWLFKLDGKKEKANLNMYSNAVLGVKSYIEDMTKGGRSEKIELWEGLADGIHSLSEGSGIGKGIISRLEKVHAEAYTKLVGIAYLHGALYEINKALNSWVEYQKLPERPDKIAAVNSLKEVLDAQVVYAKWKMEQTKQVAPKDAYVFDVLYREGEFVQAGKPVVSLLPPENIKAIFFVDGKIVSNLKLGDKVLVKLNNVTEPVSAIVSYISPKAEYTDPFIYSLKNNEKYMYLIEAKFNSANGARLHPGQPVEVDIENPDQQ